MLAMRKQRPEPHPILNGHWRAEVLTPDEQRRIGRRMIAARERAERALTPAARERAERLHRRERDRLALIMLPWIVTEAARKFGRTGYPVEDLIASAVLSILQGLRTYDPNRGAVTTHLGRWAWKGMLEAVGEHSGAVHVPRRLRQFVNRERRGDLDPATMKPKLRERYEQAKLMLGTVQADDIPLAEATAESEAESEIEADESARRIRAALERLPPRTRTVIELRFGLGTVQAEKLTLAQCGERIGLTHEMVRRIEREGLATIRRYLSDQGEQP